MLFAASLGLLASHPARIVARIRELMWRRGDAPNRTSQRNSTTPNARAKCDGRAPSTARVRGGVGTVRPWVGGLNEGRALLATKGTFCATLRAILRVARRDFRPTARVALRDFPRVRVVRP